MPDTDFKEVVEDTYADCERQAAAEAKDLVSDTDLQKRWAEKAKAGGNAFTAYVPLRTIQLLHNAMHKLRVVFGPVQGGKSWGCHMDVVFRCAQQAVCSDGVVRNRVLFSRNNYQQLKQTTFDMWMRMFPHTQIALSSPIQGELEMKLGSRKSVIKLLGIPMEMQSAEATLRSNAFSMARVEEVQYIPYKRISLILERLGRYPDLCMAPEGCRHEGYFKNLGITADTNMPVEGSWLHQRAEILKPENEIYLFQPPAMFRTWDAVRKVWQYEENRGQRLESHGIHAAENVEHFNEGWEYYWGLVASKDDDDIRRNILNEYGHILSGTPVFPEFSKSRHVAATGVPMPKGPRNRLYAGCDLGRRQRMVFGYYGENGGVRIPLVLGRDCSTEMFVRSVVVPELARRGVSPHNVTVFPDPSGFKQGEQVESTSAEILRLAGFDVAMPVLKNNDPYTRVEVVKQALTRTAIDGDPYVLIDPDGEELIRGMAGGYTYATVRGGGGLERVSDKPDKNSPYSHVCDAFQYLLVGLKYGRREDGPFGRALSASVEDWLRGASNAGHRDMVC